MAHYDISTAAFSRLAVLSIGVIYMQYRQVTCDFKGGIVIFTDKCVRGMIVCRGVAGEWTRVLFTYGR